MNEKQRSAFLVLVVGLILMGCGQTRVPVPVPTPKPTRLPRVYVTTKATLWYFSAFSSAPTNRQGCAQLARVGSHLTVGEGKRFKGRPVGVAFCKGFKDISGNAIPDNLVGVVNPDNPHQPMWIPQSAVK